MNAHVKTRPNRHCRSRHVVLDLNGPKHNQNSILNPFQPIKNTKHDVPYLLGANTTSKTAHIAHKKVQSSHPKQWHQKRTQTGRQDHPRLPSRRNNQTPESSEGDADRGGGRVDTQFMITFLTHPLSLCHCSPFVWWANSHCLLFSCLINPLWCFVNSIGHVLI